MLAAGERLLNSEAFMEDWGVGTTTTEEGDKVATIDKDQHAEVEE